MRIITPLFSLIFLFSFHFGFSQKRKSNEKPAAVVSIDTSTYKQLTFRNIGPFRGGRSVAVTGVINNDQLYYMGSTGGGIWKTEDAGLSWKNISDGYLKTGSVGELAVSMSDPMIIYAGMGEHAVRGVMTSYGDGVYKSMDGGKSWSHLGLELTRHIGDIVIHPSDPNIVLVAAQGAVHGPTSDRGIYRSINGGKTWEKTLFVDNNTGASSLVMDKNNPRILYAAMWDHIRYPWQVKSGGKGSGIYKSIDGGTSWKKLTKGLPELMGKIGITVSPANSERLWAVIEAEEGGVYRSDNGGASWVKINGDRATITRAWYYNEIFADPVNENVVFLLNAQAMRSIDGGKTFNPMPVGHGDTHDLWINPDNPDNFILGDDGGAEITFNTGKTWSSLNNQPTAQFYRVNTDNQFPYKVYGGQQDNSSVIIRNFSYYGSIGEKDWIYGPGCESAYLAFDPNDPQLILGGCYQGNISLLDMKSLTERDVMAYPVIGLGTTPADFKYRFNWNAPIITSPHNPKVVYHGGNVLFKTTNNGISWESISGDLTRNDKTKQVVGGAPFTNEGAGGENYNTIMYVAVSPHKEGTIWVGSDDGLLHLTTDEGKNWTNVSPQGMGETIINSIEVSPFDDNVVYVVSTRYKFNDFTPSIYKTTDKGKSWKKVVNGIGSDSFVRVVREDTKVKGLLYAGTEKGLYISSNSGESWTHFQLNLPIVPINDLKIQDNDLVVATAGRGFWILDDLSSIQQSVGHLGNIPMIFEPSSVIRLKASNGRSSLFEGENPKAGVILDYYLPEISDSMKIAMEITDSKGMVVRNFSNQKDKNFKPYPGGPAPEPVMPFQKGINRFSWNLITNGISSVPGVFVNGDYSGHLAIPGEYTVNLNVDGQLIATKFKVLPNPNHSYTESQFMEQHQFLEKIENRVTEIHESVVKIRSVRDQINGVLKRVEENENSSELKKKGKEILPLVDKWESNLIQPKQKTFQDVINFPNELNSEFLDLKSRMDGDYTIITQGAKQRFSDLEDEWNTYRLDLKNILDQLDQFNSLYKELNLPVVISNFENQ